MHELAVCQALLDQVRAVAADRGATAVTRIVVRIGPLSGVEPPLLNNAFSLARAGTMAETATLEIEDVPIRVACRSCGEESDATANQLTCRACGATGTQLVSGNELQLACLDLDLPETGDSDRAPRASEEASNV